MWDYNLEQNLRDDPIQLYFKSDDSSNSEIDSGNENEKIELKLTNKSIHRI